MPRDANARRVIFIPWPPVDAAALQQAAIAYKEDRDNVQKGQALSDLTWENKLGEDSKKWKANREKQIDVKHWDGKSDAIIRALSNFDVIYVQGHGFAGCPRIFTIPEPKRLEDGLLYNDVCDRLIASGMQESWGGDLKFNICESAEKTTGTNAFAAECSRYLAERNYGCKVWGYRGTVDRFPAARDRKRESSYKGEDHRAKEQRFRFIGGKLVSDSGGCTLF